VVPNRTVRTVKRTFHTVGVEPWLSDQEVERKTRVEPSNDHSIKIIFPGTWPLVSAACCRPLALVCSREREQEREDFLFLLGIWGPHTLRTVANRTEPSAFGSTQHYGCSKTKKSLLHPQHMGVGTHHPQPMKIDFLPLELYKTGQITT
jgi:hypothetical protein